jgi:putative transcriptional regulator
MGSTTEGIEAGKGTRETEIAMARKSKIVAGLKDAVRYSRGDRTRGKAYSVRMPDPIDVRAIRRRLGLSQSAFAMKYGFPLSTLRGWEQGRRSPPLASRNFLLVIDKHPRAVEAALAAAA